MQELTTRCCVVGGGPAGMMLGLLFARAGIDVIVLEKHADFLRDFRGDTIHPSTLEVMHDLGLFDAFLKLPHQEQQMLAGKIGDVTLPIADFAHLPTHAKFLAFMPQWDFLDFLAKEAERYPNFKLIRRAEVEDLLVQDGQIRGVAGKAPDGPLRIEADFTAGCDGRHSIVREKAGFVPLDIGAPMDILWFRLSRLVSDPHEAFGRMEAGQILVLIDRGAHWQCGYVVPKGSAGMLQQQDVDTLRRHIAALAPFLADRVHEIATWDDVKLLTVAVDRLPLWHKPGLLCIGDAAHAMSPVGGVGINLAIQDAVATANLFAGALLAGRADLEPISAALQKRREFAVRVTQAMQVFLQRRVISHVLASRSEKLAPPWFMRAFIHWPLLRRLPARLVGIGVQPERVTAPELKPVRG